MLVPEKINLVSLSSVLSALEYTLQTCAPPPSLAKVSHSNPPQPVGRPRSPSLSTPSRPPRWVRFLRHPRHPMFCSSSRLPRFPTAVTAASPVKPLSSPELTSPLACPDSTHRFRTITFLRSSAPHLMQGLDKSRGLPDPSPTFR